MNGINLNSGATAPGMPTQAAPTAPSVPSVTPSASLTKMPAAVAELIKGFPVLKPVLSGELPGVRVRPGIFYPKAWALAEHAEKLFSAGLDIYLAQDGSQVLFNPQQMDESALQKADKDGSLAQLIPDYQDVTRESPVEPDDKTKGRMAKFYEKVYGGFPGMKISPPGAGVAPQGQPIPAGGGNMASDLLAMANRGAPAAMPPPPASAQTMMAGKRAINLQPGSPTSGPVPGAGRVLNALARPAV